MEQCDYWWQNTIAEQCSLINGACKCGGSNERCCIKGQSIPDALKREEKLSLDEAFHRATQRRRHGMQTPS